MLQVARTNSFLADTLAAHADELFAYMSTAVQRLPTGWPLLDQALADRGCTQGGFVVPSLIALGAPPKAGKSLWAQHVAQALVQQGHWCLYWDMENGAKRFAQRLGWRMAKLASAEHARGLTEPEKARHEKVRKWLKNHGQRFCYKHRKTDVNRDTVSEWLQDAHEVCDATFVMIVDSLQKLPLIEKDRRTSIDMWLQFFEEARSRFQCIIIMVSELPREAYAKKRNNDLAPPFKESGDVEYSCDLGMTFSPVGKGSPRSAYLDIWWDRDGARDVRRIAKYTRVLPYYQIVEEPLQKREGVYKKSVDGESEDE